MVGFLTLLLKILFFELQFLDDVAQNLARNTNKMAFQGSHAAGMSNATDKPTYTFAQLSASVSVYRPNIFTTLDKRRANSPKLILLATWMDARDEHIIKYITRYQNLHPTACILVAKSFLGYYFSPAAARRDMLPAAGVIRDILQIDNNNYNYKDTNNNNTPDMLIHVFSNGGSCMLYHLYDLYAESYRRQLLPPHVTIFDSLPGRWNYSAGTGAVLVGLPSGLMRLLFLPFVHLLGIFWWIKFRVLRIPEEASVWALAHNDTSRVRETGRAYVYSEADTFVHFSTVEEHADQAEGNGFVVERREKFVNSSHVAHARSDPDRYWAFTKEVWEASFKSIGGKKIKSPL